MAKLKTGPLSRAEIFYIDSHVLSKTPEEIGKDLARSETTVTKHIKTLNLAEPQPEEPEEEESEESEGPKMAKAGDLMKRTTESGSDEYGVAVMTKEASELGDEQRKKHNSSDKRNPANQKGVFVMNPDKKCK